MYVLVTIAGGPRVINCEFTADGNQQALPTFATNTYQSPVCGASWLLQRIGLLISWFAWAAIAVLAALTVWFRRDVGYWWTGIIVMAIIFLVPIILSFCEGSIYNTWIGNTLGGFTCQPHSLVRPYPIAQWFTFVTPMCLCILIGGVCLGYVLVSFFRVSEKTSSFHVQQNVRLVLFELWMLLYAGITLAAFIHQFVFTFPSTTTAVYFSYWNLCLSYADVSTCGDLGWYVSPIVYGLSQNMYPLNSCFIGLLFLCQKDLWINWGERIAPWKGVYIAIFHFKSLAEGSGATTTTAGSSSSSSSEGSTFMSDIN